MINLYLLWLLTNLILRISLVLLLVIVSEKRVFSDFPETTDHQNFQIFFRKIKVILRLAFEFTCNAF